MAGLLYRWRWPMASLSVVVVFGLVAVGGKRLKQFSSRVDSFKDQPPPPDKAQPKAFDARFDIWFDPQDSSLRVYRDIESQFIADDTVLIAFEEPDHPWGAFSPKALETAAKLTREIERVPFVRRVRSLTSNPWIRWGEAAPGEQGLLISDLFEKEPSQYSEAQRLRRMIAIVGAKRSSRLVGEAKVRSILGADADFSRFIGEPRLVGGIVSDDGRVSAIQVQVLRPKVPKEKLDATFGDDTNAKVVAQAMHGNESQWQALAGIAQAIERVDTSDYTLHVAGMPRFEKNFMDVGMSDMTVLAAMFAVIVVVLFLLFRRVSGVVVPVVVVFSSLAGLLGTIWALGDLFNNLTAMVPSMITAIAVANAVHLVAAYFLLRRSARDKRELIVSTIKKNALPVLLTSLTTAVGFFSLTVSDIIPMRMLGYTGGIATLMVYAVTMSVVPALLSLLPLRKPDTPPQLSNDEKNNDKRRDAMKNRARAVPAGQAKLRDRLVRLVLRRRSGIVVVSLALTALAIVGLRRVEISSDFRAMFPDQNKVIQDFNWIERKLSGAGDLEIVFQGPRNREPESARRHRQARLEALQIKQLRHERDGAAPLSPSESSLYAKLRQQEQRAERSRIAASHLFLERVDSFEKRLKREREQQPGSPLALVTKFESALDVLRKMHQVQNENSVDFYRLGGPEDVPPQARAPAIEVDPVTDEVRLIPGQNASTLNAQYYLQYENGAKPTENLSRLVTPDRRSFRISARLKQAKATAHQAAFERIREIARTEFPELAAQPDVVENGEALSSMTLTGKLYLFANMIQRFTYAFIASVSLALIVITVVIATIFRSVRLGLVSLIPNVLPLIIPLGVLGLFGLPLDGPAVIVVSVALGICVDDTVHFFSSFVRERKAGATTEEALRRTFHGVGGALTATSIVLVAGFSVLGLSDFRPNLMIGQLAVVMIALAWVADFIVTPAFISLVMSRRRSRPTVTVPRRRAAVAGA